METTPQEKTFTIVRLHSRNWMNLAAEGVEIVPNRSVVTITGRNDMGKSAVLSSIFGVLTGKLPAAPVRQGASRAEIETDMGDFTAKLTIPAQGAPRLTLRTKDGADIRSPRTLLESYSNPILLDIVGFIRMGETAEGRRKQMELVRKLPGVNLDFSKLDADRRQAYEERTAVTRDLTTSQGRLSNYPLDPSAPVEEVRIADLLQHQSVARAHNKECDKVKQNWKDAAAFRDSLILKQDQKSAEIVEVMGEIERLQLALKIASQERTLISTELLNAEGALANHDQAVAALKYADEDAIQAQIAAADETNTKVRGNKRRKEIQAEIAAHQQKVDELTERIAAIDQSKQSQVAAAKFPVEGLSFDEGGLLLNGLPLSEDQQSRAKILTAAIAIGFAFKPRIPVVLFRDASILDADSRKAVAELVDANGGQVWEEIVSSIGPDGKPVAEPFSIVIEDGRIAS